MASVNISPVLNEVQYFGNDGLPLAGGKIYSYVAGSTSVGQTTYTTSAGAVANSNPIVLDSSGRLTTEIWLENEKYYHLVLTDANDVALNDFDNVIGAASGVTPSIITSGYVLATSQGQTTVTLGDSYSDGSNTLEISVNGSIQILNVDYAETSSTQITFSTGLNLGDVVYYRIFSTTLYESPSATGITYTEGAAGSVSRTVASRLQDIVSVKDFGAKGDGVADDTAAIQGALNSGAASVLVPTGVYKITSSISIPNYVTLRGNGFSQAAGTALTRLVKTGNFTGVIVNVASQLIDIAVDGATGNGGDGVQIKGGRSFVKNVSACNHGQDGFHIGKYAADTGTNTNIWWAQGLIARSNTRHGILIDDEGTTTLPNANAGTLLGCDCGYNGGDGIKIIEAIDNKLHGVVAQSNTGYGIHCAQYALGNYIADPYLEANTAGDAIFDSGADRNYLIGVRAGVINSGYTNNGNYNTILGRYGSISNLPLHEAAEAFTNITFLEKTTSGLWALQKEATTRNLNIQLTGTSASGDVLISNTGGGAAGLRFATGGVNSAMRGIITTGGTYNFGSIAANSSVDYEVTGLTGADNTYRYVVTPNHAIPVGIMWGAYYDPTAGKLYIRCTNAKTTAVTVNGSFFITGYKIV